MFCLSIGSSLKNLLNENYELVVPEQVIKELKSLKGDRLKKVSGKDKSATDLALQLLDVNKIKKIKPVGKDVDQAIINLSKENSKNIVCTLDREMRQTLGRVILIMYLSFFLSSFSGEQPSGGFIDRIRGTIWKSTTRAIACNSRKCFGSALSVSS